MWLHSLPPGVWIFPRNPLPLETLPLLLRLRPLRPDRPIFPNPLSMYEMQRQRPERRDRRSHFPKRSARAERSDTVSLTLTPLWLLVIKGAKDRWTTGLPHTLQEPTKKEAKDCDRCRIGRAATALLINLRRSRKYRPTVREYEWDTLNRNRLMESELRNKLSTEEGWAEFESANPDTAAGLKSYKDAATAQGLDFPDPNLQWLSVDGKLLPDSEPKPDFKMVLPLEAGSTAL
jgi:hypothetical protein